MRLGLVNYSDSDSEQESSSVPTTSPPAKKKRKVSNERDQELPPLPASFLDQYSSAVRTSTQDDPALHGGRKRVTPHVEGNWPTHVFVEWHPQPTESKLLSEIVAAVQKQRPPDEKSPNKEDVRPNKQSEHSLLESDLGVPLPLHISLSRPLVLKANQKESYLKQIESSLNDNNIKAFRVTPKDLSWHPNETNTRLFLVMRLQQCPGSDLSKILGACNAVASDFGKPLLYAESKSSKGATADSDQFHISLAWSLPDEELGGGLEASSRRKSLSQESTGIPYDLLGRLTKISISFTEVKVRIGQDVHSIPLKALRKSSHGVIASSQEFGSGL